MRAPGTHVCTAPRGHVPTEAVSLSAVRLVWTELPESWKCADSLGSESVTPTPVPGPQGKPRKNHNRGFYNSAAANRAGVASGVMGCHQEPGVGVGVRWSWGEPPALPGPGRLLTQVGQQALWSC